MPLRKDGTAPYAPPRTVLDVIDRYRDHGLTTPITIDVLLRAGVPESLGARTLQALRLLELIDAKGEPTDALKSLGRATSTEYPERFGDLLKSVYAEVFAFVDPAKDPIERVHDAFRAFEPRGQRSRMATLFLGLCEYAGLVENAPRKPPGPRPARDAQKSSKATRSTTSNQRNQGSQAKVKVQTGIPAALVAVLDQLPPEGSTWSTNDRDTFVRAFTAMLDLVVKVDGTLDHGSRPRAIGAPQN